MAVKKKISKPSWWAGLKRLLSDLTFGITGKRISIVDIEPEENELGYTSAGNQIHLAYYHEMINGLSKEKTIAFIKGVFAHELGHKLMTPFDMLKIMLDKIKNRYEKQIFMAIYNATEDAALEYQLPCYIGGHLLKCLEFMIGHVYKESPPIDKKGDDFSQYMQALIHYGDGGLVKGKISSPKAREIFLKTTPIFDKIIEEPNGAMRLIMTKDIFNLSRPLWEHAVKEAEAAEKLMEKLKEMLKDAAKGDKHEGGTPMTDVARDESAAGSGNPKKTARRKITIKRISKEEAKAMGLDSSKASVGSELPEGDITAYIVEGEEPPDSSGSAVPAPAALSDKKGSESEEGSAEKRKGKDSADSKDCADKASSDGASVPDDEEPDGDGEISSEEYELTADDIAQISEELETSMKEEAAERHESELASETNLEVKGLDHFYGRVSCKNYFVTVSTTEDFANQYADILAPIKDGVDLLYNQLKKIFRNKAEEKVHTRSGRLNIERAFGSKITVNLFDRRRVTSAQDIAVMLCIDESGSMRGSKAKCARQAAIGLSEVFAKLNIPLAVMGFTADEGANVSHYHYLNWHTSPAERMRLLGISARSNNFDGYSIRYAAELLKRRKEKNKLLIIISDGQPACLYYRSAGSGIADTQNAIKNASKDVDIIGVGVDTYDTAVLHAMYQRYFVEVRQASQIFYKLGAVIKDRIRKWD